MKRVLSQEEIPADVIEKAAAWQAKRRDFDPSRGRRHADGDLPGGVGDAGTRLA
jgi:hypothetical protein